MNNEDFVTYDIAQALKKAGFDWACRHYYTKENAADSDAWLTTAAFSPEDWNNGKDSEPDFLKPLCSAPTLAQAQKWLINKGYYVEVQLLARDMWSYAIADEDGDEIHSALQAWNCYESALSAGIEAALKLINKEPNKEINNETETNTK